MPRLFLCGDEGGARCVSFRAFCGKLCYLHDHGGERRQDGIVRQMAVQGFADEQVRRACQLAGLVAEVDGATEQLAAQFSIHGEHRALMGGRVFAHIQNGAGAFAQRAVFFSQCDERSEELKPRLAGFRAASKYVAFQLDAFAAIFAAVGADDAAAFVAGLAARVNGGAIQRAEFLAGEEEGESARG